MIIKEMHANYMQELTQNSKKEKLMPLYANDENKYSTYSQ